VIFPYKELQMLCLIDGDIVAYRCAASCEPTKEKHERDPLDIAIARADSLLYRIVSDTQSTEYRLFLSGTGNFRKKLYPEYKANRERLPRPVWLDELRKFLVEEWKSEVTSGIEADDGIGIAAKGDFIICTIDKDLLQIPGQHYNFIKGEFFEMDERDSALAFWSSMLIGDAADNLRGIPSIGPARARKALSGLNPKEMEAFVRSRYGEAGLDFSLFYRLYRVIRSEEELKEVLDETEKREKQREAAAKSSSEENTGGVPGSDRE
jgi:5'-3' exonuclease